MATQTAVQAQSDADRQILLESGTNELEVLIFGMGTGSYGINVAKVREVIKPVPITVTPQRPAAVLGMFNLRGRLMPLVDLPSYLNIKTSPSNEKFKRVIVTEFNGINAGFLVDKVEHIHRLSWAQIHPPTDAATSQTPSVTGITEVGKRLILMLDFESIVDHISMIPELHKHEAEDKSLDDRSCFRVFFADDSRLLRSLMESALINGGYSDYQCFSNGQEAWQAIQQAVNDGQPPDIVVTDIEMPQMDGLTLTRRIKEDPQLRQIPVILFSSLITADTLHKGQQVGADDQLAKPHLPEVVAKIDQWIQKTQRGLQGDRR